MGCSESKQNSVATGNTIFRRKNSDNGSSKNSNDTKTVQETTINDDSNNMSAANSVLQQQPGESTDGNIEAAQSSGGEAPFAAKDMANESSGEALKGDKKIEEGGDNKEGVNNGDDHNDNVEERLICRDSPRHFFSSRKDHHEELGIDGIKSEYNTPRHGAGHKLINLLADQEQVSADKLENGTEVEPVNVANNLVNEEEIKVSTPADDQQKKGDDLNIQVEEKHMDDSQNNDLKAT
ncbi:hypothetical protein FNV43_RR00795 [Rhamnella rubrinervis]|uniref:Uncharacterized protein n=1 Tax=Rhamnella rubrinervis TaxID=2594499 RepID=A0A8K0HPA5_9ROSA|nr:hypothetical protein FNV43_RR00795 [Rhamnella rubrinervis]